MKLLTVKQVAEMLQAKPSTVYGWAEQRIIPSFKIGGLLRSLEDDILDWIKGCQLKQETTIITSTGRKAQKKGG